MTHRDPESEGADDVHHQPKPTRATGPPRAASPLAAAAAALHNVGERTETASFTATGVQELVVGVHAGRIELVPSRDDTVQVTTTRHWSVWAPAPGHRRVGGILALSGDCPPLGDLGVTRCAVDERLSVPAGTRVRVTAGTGDLVATDLAAASLDARLSRGSITASFTRPPDRVLARLDAGNLRLVLPSATYAVDAAAPRNAGHVSVQVPTERTSPHRISARISRGDLQILSQ